MSQAQQCRVVVTGVGCVTPAGIDTKQTWEHVKEGTCCIGPITLVPEDERGVHFAGEVRDFDAKEILGARHAKRSGRFTHFGLVAAREAFAQAGWEGLPTDRTASYVSCCVGSLEATEEASRILETRGHKRVPPLVIPIMLASSVAGEIAIDKGLHGVSQCFNTACATGATSIGEAFEAIRAGRLDRILAGGAEAPISAVGLSGFNNLGALTKVDNVSLASIPFDARRSGFVMGEGACVLALEERESAIARGATILGEILGYGATNDAHHITSPNPDASGIVAAIEMALEQAGISPEDVDHLNAHGTSTQLNDETEAKAFHKVFGERANKIPVAATKSVTGHMFSASAAAEAVMCLCAMQDQVFPATASTQEVDETLDVHILREPKAVDEGESLDICVSTSLGFGGYNVALVLGRGE